ncbi:conserved membrane protein of unknown function [Tenacibaculum sp. 190130A14a]|uniref:DUF5367 domain-containing protein n=1 Tax=Tenacibaculum polynesiense TaxID=3137857 RepID=A0ABM9PD71_9FLAO
MISKSLFSIITAIFVWVLGVCFYLLSFYITLLNDLDLQANIILALGLIPSAYLGTYLFYRKHYLKPSSLALLYILVITLLDACITVPVFLIPNGGSYSDFFGDLKFYAIVIEIYAIVWYFGNYITNKKRA